MGNYLYNPWVWSQKHTPTRTHVYIYIYIYICHNPCSALLKPVTSRSRAPHGLFPSRFWQKSYGHIRCPCVIFANSGCGYSLTYPSLCRTAPLRVPHGLRAGTVGYEKYCRFPCGTRTTPVRASHGVSVESCELFDQAISVQPYQTVDVTTTAAPA